MGFRSYFWRGAKSPYTTKAIYTESENARKRHVRQRSLICGVSFAFSPPFYRVNGISNDGENYAENGGRLI